MSVRRLALTIIIPILPLGAAQGLHLGGLEPPPRPRGEVSQGQGADGDPHQLLHLVADGGAHATDLPVPTLAQDHLQPALPARGPQAAVDVRSGLPFASSLVAPGLTMIGAEAGCRYPDRVHPYLNNLNRLGLVWFSRETLEDPQLYQVLEAQPEVIDALAEAGRLGRTVRRSIHLTPFGADFCNAALPSDTLEFEAVVDTYSAADRSKPSAEEREGSGPLDPVPPSPEPGGAEEHRVG